MARCRTWRRANILVTKTGIEELISQIVTIQNGSLLGGELYRRGSESYPGTHIRQTFALKGSINHLERRQYLDQPAVSKRRQEHHKK